MRARLAILLTLAACGQSASKLDRAETKPKASLPDPWASSHGAKKDDDDDNSFDAQGAWDRIREGIEKPGPYEALEKSAGFDKQKAHWGVLRVRGQVVEREAFSWSGGHGTELRTLIDRLRELAKLPMLDGIVLRIDGIEISLPDAI